jgi:mRNA interferase HigB
MSSKKQQRLFLLKISPLYTYYLIMKLINEKQIVKAKRNFPDLRNPLIKWVEIMKENDFDNLQEIRNVFPRSDKVGCCLVFGIKSNNYRIIADIDFTDKTIDIIGVYTHAEYDKEKRKKECE